MCTLTQFKKIHIKEDLIAWFDHSTPLKGLLFCSLHNIQNRYKGATLCFLLLLLLAHKRTMTTKKIASNRRMHHPSHSKQRENQMPKDYYFGALEKWSTNSSSHLLMKHLFRILQPLPSKLIKSWIASQEKKPTFVGTNGFHTVLVVTQFLSDLRKHKKIWQRTCLPWFHSNPTCPVHSFKLKFLQPLEKDLHSFQ